jgi:hypothetical protein
VTGFPGQARFAGIRVTPTVFGGDHARLDEYEAAAARAHDLCLIGRALAAGIAYEVGPVTVRPESPPPLSAGAARGDDGDRLLAWRAA